MWPALITISQRLKEKAVKHTPSLLSLSLWFYSPYLLSSPPQTLCPLRPVCLLALAWGEPVCGSVVWRSLRGTAYPHPHHPPTPPSTLWRRTAAWGGWWTPTSSCACPSPSSSSPTGPDGTVSWRLIRSTPWDCVTPGVWWMRHGGVSEDLSAFDSYETA